MEQDASQLIQQRITELPPDVRNAVQAADLSKKIQAVGAKNNLHIDQIGELEDEALLAMLGFSPLATFGARLAVALHIEAPAAEALAADIAAEVFGPIRESMKKFVEEREQKAAPTLPETAPPASSLPPKPPVAAPAPIAPDLHQADPSRLGLAEADVMLTQKTVDLPPAHTGGAQADLPPTQNSTSVPNTATPLYKVDPYHEPV